MKLMSIYEGCKIRAAHSHALKYTKTNSLSGFSGLGSVFEMSLTTLALAQLSKQQMESKAGRSMLKNPLERFDGEFETMSRAFS